jgi:hypothetical protein
LDLIGKIEDKVAAYSQNLSFSKIVSKVPIKLTDPDHEKTLNLDKTP